MTQSQEITKNEKPSMNRTNRPAFLPACDVYESKDEILVLADLPGVAPEALEIAYDKGELSLKAKRDVATEGKPLGAEFGDCDFRRTFTVPGGIDTGRISAELKNGVLFLHLPKSEMLKPRQITVRGI